MYVKNGISAFRGLAALRRENALLRQQRDVKNKLNKLISEPRAALLMRRARFDSRASVVVTGVILFGVGKVLLSE